ASEGHSMDDTTETPVEDPVASAVEALIDVLDRTIGSADMQDLLLQRLVTSGDVIPSRIPAPLNITEIGGYLNLLEGLGADELRSQTLASILGVAGPLPAAGLPTSPILFFAEVPNHRPAGPAQPSIPVEIRVRSDFVAALSGGVSRSGSSRLTGYDILKSLEPDVVAHISGGPIPMPDEEIPRVIDDLPGAA